MSMKTTIEFTDGDSETHYDVSPSIQSEEGTLDLIGHDEAVIVGGIRLADVRRVIFTPEGDWE